MSDRHHFVVSQNFYRMILLSSLLNDHSDIISLGDAYPQSAESDSWLLRTSEPFPIFECGHKECRGVPLSIFSPFAAGLCSNRWVVTVSSTMV